jgi:hypothetical protein
VPAVLPAARVAVEELKPLGKILDPDERNLYFRGVTLPKLHDFASGISLNATVPEAVRNQFAIARNAYVYSRFFFPFQMAGLVYSILAIELALQMRVKEAEPGMFIGIRQPTLYRLLEYALRQRWVLDSGFNVSVAPDFRVAEKITKRFDSIPHEQRYSYNFLDVLIYLRNDLAHGTFMLAPGMGFLLARHAELINQLFPQSNTAHV